MVLASFISPIIRAGGTYTVKRYIFDEEWEKSELLGYVLFISLALFSVILCLSPLLGALINLHYTYLFSAIILGFLISVYEILYAYSLIQKLTKDLYILVISIGIMDLILIEIFIDLLQVRTVGMRLLILMVSNAMVIMYFILKYRLKLVFDYKRLWNIITFGLPLIVHHLAASLAASMDKFLIGNLLSMSTLADYSVMYSLISVMLIVLDGFTKSHNVSRFNFYKQNRYDFMEDIRSGKTPFILSLVTGSVTPLVVFIFGPLIFKEVNFDLGVLYILSLGFVILSSYKILSAIVFYSKDNLYILRLGIINAVTTVGVSYILVLYFGIFGAAFATVISYLTLLIGVYFWIYRHAVRGFDF